MLLLPRWSRTAHFPTALIGIVLATSLVWVTGWQIDLIGAIPSTIILDDRYLPSVNDLGLLGDLIAPAAAIAALGAIEKSLGGHRGGQNDSSLS